jgi:3-hydroxyisobutyrate dehydrogenase-like beta-hydroxyacid dehydrogenase
VGKRIAFVGTGAVGGYIGEHIVRQGKDVRLIDHGQSTSKTLSTTAFI